jgi:hypothetical protein
VLKISASFCTIKLPAGAIRRLRQSRADNGRAGNLIHSR